MGVSVIFKKGDKVIWMCEGHKDYGKTFTVENCSQWGTMIYVSVEERPLSGYNGKYFVLDTTWNTKLAKVLR